MIRWIPRGAQYVLEPAVGDGALIDPLLKRGAPPRIFAVDVDGEAAATVAAGRPLVTSIHADFLNSKDSTLVRGGFDAAIMNPPFQAKQWICAPKILGSTKHKLPVEAAFLARALSFVKQGGRLVALLPASVISAPRLTWFRRAIAEKAHVRCVQELPPNTFVGVDAGFYILVLDKGARTAQSVLRNHKVWGSDSLKLPAALVSSGGRLDYSFHEGLLDLKALHSQRDLDWHPLKNTATVQRGDTPAVGAQRKPSLLHTDGFRNGWWRVETRQSSPVEPGRAPLVISNGDLALPRIHKSWADRCGLYCGAATSFSDCIFRLRPTNGLSENELLFGLRMMLGYPFVRAILERSTGVRYITAEELSNLAIPTGLATAFRVEWRDYQMALSDGDFDRMNKIEHVIRSQLLERARQSH